ncbi:uncharacterized protein LOC134781262 [Penaeus indicus]|uniref:uncharacterized protein LOC134781262 n=1 Tax=Penaeus indicus TaxID=29960 RepID=UPI00300CE09B
MSTGRKPLQCITLQSKDKDNTDPRRELLFADDSTLVAHTPEQMQRVLDAFSSASKRFGLQINIKKTEVLFQPSSTHVVEEDILVDGMALNRVADFTYLGSTISDDARIDPEITKRMAKASSAFGRLRTRLWNNHHVSIRVKCKIYRAILPVGERKIGLPRLRYKDTIKRNLKKREINIKTWTTLACQRAKWRSAVK